MTDKIREQKENVWPDYVLLRDTHLHDDLGGCGQRIYTTAGAGYEKRKYVRADTMQEMLDRIEELEEAYATYRHAAQSAFEPGCDCATCALVRGEALAKLNDD